jgi:gamma-glutamyl-gamma-aminobutyrate hydrolase PuuD
VSRPVIGISTYLEDARWGVWSRPAALLPRTYVDAVVAAGGTPVLLPPVPAAGGAVAAVDALVLAGGADLDPASYDAGRHSMTGPTYPERDAAELRLLRHTLDAGKPVLGVCRGMQLLNVALGGGLAQHLPDVAGHLAHQPAPAQFGSSVVRVRPASRLAGIVGTELTVSCYHHQAIDGVGAGLVPAAWAASDETVEAIELTGDQFVLGVQWHPEEDVDVRLFRALVDAAGGPARRGSEAADRSTEKELTQR